MKRTTVFVDEDVLRKLREIAKRENSSVAEVTRKALVAVPAQVIDSPFSDVNRFSPTPPNVY